MSANRTKTSTYGNSNDFIRLSNVTSTNVQKIQSHVREMKKMLNDLVAKPDDRSKLSELNDVHQKTNTLVKETAKFVNDLQNIPNATKTAEQKRQKIQTDRLVKEFSKTLSEFQDFQKLEKEMTQERYSVKASLLEPHVESGIVNLQPRQQDLCSVQEDAELIYLQENEKELKQLDADIQDVAELFQHLNLMIHEQGEKLDCIEDNVDTAEEAVDQGVKELRKTEELSVKARKKKCIIIAVVLTVVAIIIIIILASVLPNRT